MLNWEITKEAVKKNNNKIGHCTSIKKFLLSSD